jgi:TRAP-type C4-dicarboxylate transport system substrate-binding protein
MRVARRGVLRLAGAALAAPALTRLANGQAPVVLKLHHFFSPLSSVHTKFLVPWAKKVGAASQGRIRVDVYGSMQLGGLPAALYDQARDGVADIVWALPGLTPGRFPGTQVFEQPFVGGRRALANARAAQEFAATYLAEELRETQPLCVAAHDQGLIHATKAVATMEDLKDLKLRPPTRAAGEALRLLGASPNFVPLPQVSDAFGRKLLDGCLLPWDTAAAAKIHELMKFHAEFSASPTLSTSPYILAMNRAKYAALAPDLRKVIDDNSGDVAATMVGRMWDEQAAGIEEMVRKRGDTVGAIPAEEAARWRKATEPVVESWIKDAAALDGAKLVEAARALVAKYEAAPATAATPSAVASPPAPGCEVWCPTP